MSGTTRGRLIGLGSGAMGLGLLAWGTQLASGVVGQPIDERAQLAVRALGARHLAQGALAVVAPRSRPARWVWLVDLLHAASMALAASRPSRWRPLYLVGCALGSVMLGGDLWARTASSAGDGGR
jgi:hypothetical protein